MLGEAGVNSQAGMRAEMVPQFERKGDQREHVNGYGENAEGIEFVAADGRFVFTRGVNYDAEADDQDGIGGESLIEQKLRRGQRANEKPDGGKREKEIASRAQKSGHRTEAGPNKDGSFDGKRQRDPLAFEANGNGQRGEGQRQAGEEQSHHRRFAGFGRGYETRDEKMCCGERKHKKRQRPAVLRPEHDVERAEVRERVRQDHHDIELVQLGMPDGSKHWKRGVEKKKERGKDDGALELCWAIKLRMPAPEIELAEQERNGRERTPVATYFDHQQPCAENQEISKENGLGVFALADEHRREKPAEKREQSDALGIAAQCDRSHTCGDDNHGGEAHIEAEELVILASRPNRKIQHRSSKAGNTFRKIRLTPQQ